MGNKIFYSIIALVIVVFAAVFIFMNSASSNPEDGYYPYTDLESEQLSGATIDTLEDENYHYNKTLDETREIIDAGDGEFVYFWSPTCSHCAAATPFLIDAFNQTDEEVTQLNILEYNQAWNEYGIESTPTLAYYEDGEEVDRFVGNPGNADEYVAFINAMTGAE